MSDMPVETTATIRGKIIEAEIKVSRHHRLSLQLRRLAHFNRFIELIRMPPYSPGCQPANPHPSYNSGTARRCGGFPEHQFGGHLLVYWGEHFLFDRSIDGIQQDLDANRPQRFHWLAYGG